MTLRISYSVNSDVVITDTVDGFNQLIAKCFVFLDSSDSCLQLHTDVKCIAHSPQEFLPNLFFEKTSNPICVSFRPLIGVLIAGSVENLRVWCTHFIFPPDAQEGTHHHPEYIHHDSYLDSKSLSVIIEIRDEYESV